MKASEVAIVIGIVDGEVVLRAQLSLPDVISLLEDALKQTKEALKQARAAAGVPDGGAA